MQINRVLAVVVLSVFGTGFSIAGWGSPNSTPAAALSQLLSAYSTYTANFTQQTYSNKGALIKRASGRVMLERPGKFRWETKQPLNQVIIANGHYLWVYDVDLMQANQASGI